MKAKETAVRLLILFCGLIIAHFGVTLFLLADWGADPFNVLIQGIFRSLTKLTGWSFLTHGGVHMAVCFFIIVILLFVDRRTIKIGTFLCMFCGGPIIDGFTFLLKGVFNQTSPFLLRACGLAAGCVILAGGMSIVMKSGAGIGPNDLVAVVASDKLHRPFSVVRIITDFCFVLIGFLLGGVLGAGTIVCACLVGPAAGLFLPHSERLVGRIVARL